MFHTGNLYDFNFNITFNILSYSNTSLILKIKLLFNYILHYTTTHYIIQLNTTLYNYTLHYTTTHYIIQLHTTLYNYTLHYTTKHYISLMHHFFTKVLQTIVKRFIRFQKFNNVVFFKIQQFLIFGEVITQCLHIYRLQLRVILAEFIN